MFIWEERNYAAKGDLRENDATHFIFKVRPESKEKGHIMKTSMIRWVLLSLVILSFSATSFGQIAVGISVRIGPPPLPVYAQPICPGPGYFWTPGYWAWDDDEGYYWVPGTWVVAPVGMLWTPGYWGWGGEFYSWHPGYWGPHVGFYGGINYGFGYTGVGFHGGEWRRDRFYYNRSVTNVSVTNVTNVYNKTVIVNNNTTVSYNGGTGGVKMRPTPQEESFSRERHAPELASQMQHQHAAMRDRQNFAAVNHGRPAIAATGRPGDFSSRSVVPARAAGGEYRAPAISPREARVNSGSFNRGNATPGNRGNAGPANRGNGNEGFRPFTPPSRGGNPNANMNGNRGNSMPVNRGNGNNGVRDNNPTFRNGNPNANMNGNRGNASPDNKGNPNDGYRQFNPPPRGGNSNPNVNSNRDNGNFNRGNENRGNENRNNVRRPQNQPRQAQPAQNASPANRPAPQQQQHRQGPPPKEERHR